MLDQRVHELSAGGDQRATNEVGAHPASPFDTRTRILEGGLTDPLDRIAERLSALCSVELVHETGLDD